MAKITLDVVDAGEISDGYHTFLMSYIFIE